MKTEALDERLKLGGWFWLVYFLTAPVVLWAFSPWKWDEPWISRVIAGVLLPFLFAIAAYVFLRFAYLILVRRTIGRNDLIAFAIVLVYLSIGSLVLAFFDAVASYRSVGVACLTASAILLFDFARQLLKAQR